MSVATNDQVQQFVTSRFRPRAEQIRALLLAMEDDRAAIDDIYANLSSSTTWVDVHDSNPPHLLTPSDVLGMNAFLADAITMMRGHGQLPIILKACVQSIDGRG